MFIVIAIIYFGGRMLKEYLDDVEIRNEAIKRGWDEYPSSTGTRDIKTNKKCYTSPTTGKKTLF